MRMPLPAARGRLHGGARQTRRAEVLQAHEAGHGEDLQAGLDEQLLHERVAHLDHTAVRRLGILQRGERGAMEAVAAGVGAEEDDRVARARWPRAA